MRSIDGVKKFQATAAIPTQIIPWGSIIEAMCFSVAAGRGGQSNMGDTVMGTSGSYPPVTGLNDPPFAERVSVMSASPPTDSPYARSPEW